MNSFSTLCFAVAGSGNGRPCRLCNGLHNTAWREGCHDTACCYQGHRVMRATAIFISFVVDSSVNEANQRKRTFLCLVTLFGKEQLAAKRFDT